jgi:hypothetical protein
VQLVDSWTWNGKKDSDMTVDADGRKVSKTTDNHDYSLALGSVGFTSGQHEWEMRILNDIDGVTVGVCTKDVRLDKCVAHDSHGKVWYWNPHGEYGSRPERGAKQNAFFGCHFVVKRRSFAKTSSGQTRRKLKKDVIPQGARHPTPVQASSRVT